jgi:glycine dehydrogenase subunit 2
MTMNATGRSTRPEGSASMSDYIHPTLTGGRGLLQDEALIFELGGWDKTGVDLPDADPDVADDLGDLVRAGPIGLPGLSEPECVRHYVRLSQKNHAIDLALYPLGSCTMKHNPRLNEKMARLAGFSDIHPLQPQSSVQGALELMDSLAHWLKTLTGMPAVALSPKAGAHGELCGLLSIRAAHRAAGHGLQSEHPRNTWRRPQPTAPTPPPPLFAAIGWRRSPRRRTGASTSRTSNANSARTWRRSWSPIPTHAACSNVTSSRSPD